MSSVLVFQKKTEQKKSIKSVCLLLVTIALILASQTSISGEYLDELAAEAEATAKVSRQNKLGSTDKKQMQEMESLLKNKKPSTYKFYTKLHKKNKVHAFEEFANDHSETDKRLSHLQKKVMDLYFTQ